jgi:hypothetical protein
MTWQDATVYSGEWFHGIQHGKGKLLLKNGTIHEGRFENNVYVEKEQTITSFFDNQS